MRQTSGTPASPYVIRGQPLSFTVAAIRNTFHSAAEIRNNYCAAGVAKASEGWPLDPPDRSPLKLALRGQVVPGGGSYDDKDIKLLVDGVFLRGGLQACRDDRAPVAS